MQMFTPLCSVADQGCLSRMLIFIHPGSRIYPQQQKRREKIKFIVFLPKNLYLALKNMGWGSGIQDLGSGKNLS